MVSKIARIAAPLAFAALFGLAACSKDPTPEEPQNFVQNDSADEIPPEATPPAPEVVKEVPPANVAVADPEININWLMSTDDLNVSDKDKELPFLKDVADLGF